MEQATAILLLSCPDQQGLVAKISSFIYANGGNIIHADHHTDFSADLFLSRIEWQLQDFKLPREIIGAAFGAIADPLGATWTLHFSDIKPRIAVWVSRQSHCLYDLLWRYSFLPAFAGASPYQRAYNRGVKIIGATAHYVTADLDEGPIIEQDVVRVSHRDNAADLIRKGKDPERVVLARAVRSHLLHRTLIYGNRTVVFS